MDSISKILIDTINEAYTIKNGKLFDL